jgi:hypothetical protein
MQGPFTSQIVYDFEAWLHVALKRPEANLPAETTLAVCSGG